MTFGPFARLEKKIDDHVLEDQRQFASLAAQMKAVDSTVLLHEANTATRHAQNQTANAEFNSKIDRIEKAVGTIDTLLPQIRLGIQQDERHLYRKKVAGKILASIIATLVTVSALIPLAQIVLGLKISIHAG
jgi:hypothetical protein